MAPVLPTTEQAPSNFRVETIASFSTSEEEGFSFDTDPEDVAKGDITRKILTKSIPITAELKDRITRLQLRTISHDQGFADNSGLGSWSWFELAILQDQEDEEIKRNSDGLAMTWRSHANRIAHSKFSQYFGFQFDEGSLLIQSLEVLLFT